MYILHLADRHPELVREWGRPHVFTCPRCGHNQTRAIDDAESLRDRQLSLPLTYSRR